MQIYVLDKFAVRVFNRKGRIRTYEIYDISVTDRIFAVSVYF